ncbi:glycosyltransferase family 39 protein [Candidatus Collierbacteria bacterium]|nr:glycosyltransferase family 39 protein [Candidatus Collierbacteria bacterium]
MNREQKAENNDQRTKVVLLAIIILAAFLRFYKLGQIPPSLDWDEVSLAYNAKSLLQTGKDEFGHSWPLSIQSFNDYKPPVYTYLLIPVLKVFGNTEFAVRFPSALAGTLAVLVTYFLVKELLLQAERRTLNLECRASPTRNAQRTTCIALISSFLLAVSPWHLQFSHIAFEANIGLFFFIAGMWLLIRAFHKNSQWSIFFSVAFMSIAMMSYHSLRLVAPLLILATLLIYRKNIWDLIRPGPPAGGPGLYWIPLILSVILTILTILTISYTVFFQKVGQSRFKATSFLTIYNLLTVNRDRLEKYGNNPVDKIINIKYFVYAKQYIKGYLDHFDLRFWFLDGDRIDRHRTPDVGLLYWWELPFLVMGLISLMSSTGLMASKEKAVLWIWFLVAPTASALTGGTPSAVRSLVFLPTFQIFTALGIVFVLRHLRKFWVIGLLGYLVIGLFEVSHYFHQYYIHSSLEYASAWQYGYKQMVDNVMADKDNYKKILITTSYDQPYIYFLWYGNYDPKIWINDGEFNKRFDKFEFKKIDRLEMSNFENTLFVGTPLEIPAGNLKWRVDYPNSQAAFLETEHL